MRALLLIGVAPAGVVAPDALPHRVFKEDGWTALALEIDPSDAEGEETALAWATAQNAILSAYVASGDVLPMPLGCVFSEGAALRHYVRQDWPNLARRLNTLAGAAEFVLQVDANRPAAAPAQACDGSDFLRQRLAQRNRRSTLSADRTAFLQDLEATAKRHATAIKRKPGHAFYAALLVQRTRADRLITDLTGRANMASALGLACRLIGPSPAYSFSELEPADA